MRTGKKHNALLQLTAPHFCAGIIVESGRVVDAAPIVKWAIGKPSTEVEAYCTKKGWKIKAAPMKDADGFKYVNGVWNRRFWKNKAHNVKLTEREFTSEQLSDVMCAMLKTMDYELEEAAPLKELQALAKGINIVGQVMEGKRKVPKKKLVDMLSRMHKMAAVLVKKKEAMIRSDKMHDGK